MKCIYCYETFEEDELTDEHIIPRAIGGNVEPINPFIVKNVCRRCNNLAGIYIDAPFTRNWFINNSRVSNSKKFIDLNNNPILPLRYMGKLNGLRYKDKICEYWLGPTGDYIYHFHAPYPDNPGSSLVGKPLNKKLVIDSGFVFLFVASNNPVWHPSIIFSAIESFKDSIIYIGNGNPPNLKPFQTIPEELKGLKEELLNLNGKEHNCSFSVPFMFEERFLAKLALGLGSLFLDSSFIDSTDAAELRKFMWEKDFVKRKKMAVALTNLIRKTDNDSEFMKNLFSWEGGHLLAFFPIGEYLTLIANFYEDNYLSILVSKNSEHWKNLFKDKQGMCFVIVPGLQKVVGPFGMGKLIAYKTDGSDMGNIFNQLKQEIERFKTVPPYNLKL